MIPKPETDTSDREIVISRTFTAPRQLVWEAWTEYGLRVALGAVFALVLVAGLRRRAAGAAGAAAAGLTLLLWAGSGLPAARKALR